MGRTDKARKREESEAGRQCHGDKTLEHWICACLSGAVYGKLNDATRHRGINSNVADDIVVVIYSTLKYIVYT